MVSASSKLFLAPNGTLIGSRSGAARLVVAG